ncbi:Cobalt transport protein CbiQ [Caloramator mitchellensis]|uniref:Cobalt transport protein CbiQ n=1 Tax=Caloramator mitchellensis TaxID=908809 RepID=A0A0R3JR37_CALMK|nr:CbiQ family ECF transporter T component [Caloramator mitchellensis]KRQ85926.1 Cobalt transport protein CbiQ [Caloramator mitchellensis]
MIREVILFSKSSRAKFIHPLLKLFFCLIAIALLGYSNSKLFFSLNIALFIILHLYYKTPSYMVTKFSMYLISFYLIAALAFLIGGDIQYLITITLRGAANSIAITFLIFTTPLDDILFVLSKHKNISEIIDIAKLMERYVILLEEELELMIKSAKSKGGFDSAKKSIRTTSTIAGMLFINTFNRWREIKDSINSRGYKGKLYYSELEVDNSIKINITILLLTILEITAFILTST